MDHRQALSRVPQLEACILPEIEYQIWGCGWGWRHGFSTRCSTRQLPAPPPKTAVQTTNIKPYGENISTYRLQFYHKTSFQNRQSCKNKNRSVYREALKSSLFYKLCSSRGICSKIQYVENVGQFFLQLSTYFLIVSDHVSSPLFINCFFFRWSRLTD